MRCALPYFCLPTRHTHTHTQAGSGSGSVLAVQLTPPSPQSGAARTGDGGMQRHRDPSVGLTGTVGLVCCPRPPGLPRQKMNHGRMKMNHARMRVTRQLPNSTVILVHHDSNHLHPPYPLRFTYSNGGKIDTYCTRSGQPVSGMWHVVSASWLHAGGRSPTYGHTKTARFVFSGYRRRICGSL